MAGLDPAIQASFQVAVWLMDWMAASRAAMTKKGMLRSHPWVRVLACYALALEIQ
jgi:hypothetical protein